MARLRDVVIVGGGHNALTCAAYLARGGLDVLVLERRGVVGGCAVTETVHVDDVGDFKFSRASYLAGLLRPHIVEELGLVDRHVRLIGRDPYSYTPSSKPGAQPGLTLWSDAQKTRASIAGFSSRDAENFERYEAFLDQAKSAIVPLLDGAPPDLLDSRATASERWEAAKRIVRSARGAMTSPSGSGHRSSALDVARLFTCPATVLLDEWFESEVLKATLCTDAIIGSMTAPSQPGSGYVLLHHVMGEALNYAGGQGSPWCYAEGGMGRVSGALAAAAEEAGAEIRTEAEVDHILLEEGGAGGARAAGVVLEGGEEVRARAVCSGCDPHTTFIKLIRGKNRSRAMGVEGYSKFEDSIRRLDFSSGAAKINLAVSRLPDFGFGSSEPGPEHMGTIHFEHSQRELDLAWQQSSVGLLPMQPVIEMTIPSSADKTIAPPGSHVVQLFVQYIPYELLNTSDGTRTSDLWQDPQVKRTFVNRVLDRVEKFCPGFKESILKMDVLSPRDLETVFGLHKGNIFHGALSLHQLFHQRPVPGFSSYEMPIPDLFLCGSGAHPGGGVSGAPGYNCAQTVLTRMGR